MCKLSQDDTNAMAPAGAPPAPPGMTFGGPATPSQSVAGPGGMPMGGAPMPGPTPQKDTKFKKLLQVAVPLVTGGLTGAFGGNWHVPGSGSEAAGNFFHQQSEMALQKQNMQAKLQQDAFLNQLRVSTERRNNFYDQYLAAKTEAAENPVAKQPNRKFTQSKDYPGYEFEEEGPEAGTMKQMMRPAGTTESGVSDLSNTGKYGEIPMGPPESQVKKDEKDTEEQPELVTDTDDKGASSSHFVDKNPHSPTFGQSISKPLNHRAAKPSASDKNKASSGKVETWAQAVADRAKLLKVDPEEVINNSKIPEDQKAAVRKRIREINTPMSKSKGLDAGTLKKLADGVPSGPG